MKVNFKFHLKMVSSTSKKKDKYLTELSLIPT